MSIAEIIVLGVALSADAFAVTISNCFVYTGARRRRLILMPIFFGAFQALMPALGYFVGGLAAVFIERYAGAVTLLILGIIGGNMIHEGVCALRSTHASSSLDQSLAEKKDLGLSTLFFQAIATAIDAFAVGVSLRAESTDIVLAASVIGITTVICCLIALILGRKLGKLLGDRAEIAGGLVLVVIGIRSFLDL
jgi:putative Mn2+ efflux pump MntP